MSKENDNNKFSFYFVIRLFRPLCCRLIYVIWYTRTTVRRSWKNLWTYASEISWYCRPAAAALVVAAIFNCPVRRPWRRRRRRRRPRPRLSAKRSPPSWSRKTRNERAKNPWPANVWRKRSRKKDFSYKRNSWNPRREPLTVNSDNWGNSRGTCSGVGNTICPATSWTTASTVRLLDRMDSTDELR